MALDPYEQLGVARDATAAEIKTAWRRKVQQMHPDKHPDDPFAATRYEQIRDSYQILSDPARRSAYDAEGSVEKDDLPARAKLRLEVTAVETLNHIRQVGKLGEINLVQALRAGLTSIGAVHERDREQTERVLRGAEKQMKRLRCKGRGSNVLGDLIVGLIEETRTHMERAAKVAQECDAAIAMLDDYEDLQDPLRIMWNASPWSWSP